MCVTIMNASVRCLLHSDHAVTSQLHCVDHAKASLSNGNSVLHLVYMGCILWNGFQDNM